MTTRIKNIQFRNDGTRLCDVAFATLDASGQDVCHASARLVLGRETSGVLMKELQAQVDAAVEAATPSTLEATLAKCLAAKAELARLEALIAAKGGG